MALADFPRGDDVTRCAATHSLLHLNQCLLSICTCEDDRDTVVGERLDSLISNVPASLRSSVCSDFGVI
jgi:hypothetical protein